MNHLSNPEISIYHLFGLFCLYCSCCNTLITIHTLGHHGKAAHNITLLNIQHNPLPSNSASHRYGMSGQAISSRAICCILSRTVCSDFSTLWRHCPPSTNADGQTPTPKVPGSHRRWLEVHTWWSRSYCHCRNLCRRNDGCLQSLEEREL